MKTKLTFEFDSISEAQNFLASQGGGQKVEVAAETTTEAPVVEEDSSDLNKLKVADLKALCDQRALAYAGRSTKAQLIDLLEGRALPVQDVAPAVTTPEVVAPVIEVPQAVATPVQPALNEAPAEVQAAPVQYDQNTLIGQFTEAFNNTKAAGVSDTDLQNTIAFHLQNLGEANKRLSQIPVDKLATFVPMFTENCNTLIQNLSPAQAPAGNNNYI